MNGQEKLKCRKCGSTNLVETPSYRRPILRGKDQIIFTVCADCFETNEFVNGKAVRIAFVPIEVR